MVGEHEAEELLAHQFGGFAAKHDVRAAAQMGFEFVVDSFVLPALGIESGQLRSRSGNWIQERSQEPEGLG